MDEIITGNIVCLQPQIIHSKRIQSVRKSHLSPGDWIAEYPDFLMTIFPRKLVR